VRDYEVVKTEQEVLNGFFLVFDDGDVTSSTANGLNDDKIDAQAHAPRQRQNDSCLLLTIYTVDTT
jgi:hypothetical protein